VYVGQQDREPRRPVGHGINVGIGT
jgi:hypothetical protein